jgi:PAS domain S-box-containing protein
VLRSISTLHKGTERIGSGDLDVKIETVSSDELGDLSRAFNDMVQKRKRTEEALRESEQKYRDIFEKSVSGLFKTAPDGRLIDTNNALARMYGYSGAEEMLAENLDIGSQLYANAEDRKKVLLTLEEEGIVENYETLVLQRDGTPFWISITARTIRDTDGTVLFYEGSIVNITKRKKAEAALKESEEKYRRIVDTAEEGIWMLDDHFRITYANQRMAEMLGYTLEEMMGKEIRSFMPKGELADHSFRTKRQRDGVNDHFERQFIRKNGSILWVFVSTTPVKDASGNFSGSFAMYSDITERKRAEEELKKFNEELERRVRERTEQINASLEEKVVLIREIHHRVRNNLQIILSLISLQSRNIKDPYLLNTIGDFKNRIVAMAHIHERMCLVDDISRIDLSEIVTFLGTSLFRSFRVDHQHIRLNVKIKDIHISINTAIPLSLILNELITNSIKHAFPNGTPGEITIEGRREADTIELSVRDTGIGMPKDFDWMSSKQSLGHRLVVSLVEQLNGTIELDQSAGTTFNIVVKEKE